MNHPIDLIFVWKSSIKPFRSIHQLKFEGLLTKVPGSVHCRDAIHCHDEMLGYNQSLQKNCVIPIIAFSDARK